MEEKKQNEEIQSRREFFKESAKKALPLLAFTALGATLFTACEKENASLNGSSSGCGRSCSGSCEGDCAGDCDDGCWQACIKACTHWQN